MHVHKVIHLVVGTFEQGLETSPVECPTVPPAPYTEKIGFHRVHWMLVSTGPEHPVSGSYEDAGIDLRSDDGSLHDRTLAGCVWSC